MGSFGRILRPIFDPGLAVAPPWWQVAGKTCVAAYQPKGAASLAASYVNLATPGTYDAAQGVAPTWDTETGWLFNGTSQYLTSGYVLSDGFSMIVRFSNAAAGATSICGEEWQFIAPQWNAQRNWRYGGIQTQLASNLAHGVMAITKPAGYVSGVAEAINSGSFWHTESPAFIGARNFAGSPMCAQVDIQAFAIYSDTLTAGEVAVVSAAMAAL